MIKNRIESSYIWLVLISVLSMTTIFNAGFDHDVLYYGVFVMSIFMGIITIIYNNRIEINQVTLNYLLFILWAFISLFWSISPIRTVIEGIQLISYALVYILARKLSQDEEGKLFIVLILVTGGIAILGLLEYVFISGSRIHATFTNPNPFGIYMVMMFMIVLSLAIRKESKALNLLSILFLSAVFLSGSRASIGALAVALIISFFGIKKSDIRRSIIKTAMIIISSFILSQILLYLSVYIRENIFIDQSLLDSITRSSSFVTSSLKGRLEFWRVAFELFKNKPLSGYGQGTYFSAYYIEYGMNEWYSRFTHNHYLQIMSELGFVGITLFLGFLWTALKSIVYNAKQSSKSIYFWGMVAALVAFLLHIGVDFTWNFPAVTLLFFFFLGVTTKEDKKEPFVLNRTISVVGLVLIILITGWQLGSTKLYMRALDLEQTKGVEVALNLTQKINRGYPISSFGQSYESDLLYQKYLKTQNQDDLYKSFSAAEKALKNAPYNAGVNTKLAKLYHNTGDFENAEKYYLVGTRYSAYVLDSFIELGNHYIEVGEKDKAVDTLLSALERAPFAIKRAPKESKDSTVDSVAIIHLTLTKIYNESGKTEKVQEQVNQLIDLKEEYPFLEKYFR